MKKFRIKNFIIFLACFTGVKKWRKIRKILWSNFFWHHYPRKFSKNIKSSHLKFLDIFQPPTAVKKLKKNHLIVFFFNFFLNSTLFVLKFFLQLASDHQLTLQTLSKSFYLKISKIEKNWKKLRKNLMESVIFIQGIANRKKHHTKIHKKLHLTFAWEFKHKHFHQWWSRWW